MNNLVLLCPFHHRSVHEGGWRVEMDEWGAPRFFNPLGVRMSVAPAASDIGGLVPRDAPETRSMSSAALRISSPARSMSSAALRMASSAQPSVSSTPLADPWGPSVQDFGLARWHGQDGIGAWTGATLWGGERLDWGWAMMCLWRKEGEGWREGEDARPE